MPDYARDMLWNELLGDREFHSLDEIKNVHPNWRLGLRLLLKWGWKFERGSADEIRIKPESPNTVPDKYSTDAVEAFIELAGPEEPRGHAFRVRELKKEAKYLNKTARALEGDRPARSPGPTSEPRSEELSDSADLELGRGLSVAADFLTETAAVIARKGSGKSYFAMQMAEEMARLALPFCVLDPTGAWWGLRSGADGNPDDGVAIPILGGEHGDISLAEGDALVRQGTAVAEALVVSYPQSLLVDLSLITPEEQHAFAAAFFARLFLRSRQAIHLFVDEADEFCPQHSRTLSEAKVLAQLDRLVRRGRIKGVGLTLITQRSAVISKNVLTQVGALFLLRTVGPQDLKAVEEWIKRHHTREVVEALLKNLPGLPQGVLYHVTGGSKKPSKHEVSRRKTWDSSKTPSVGEVIEAPPLRPVDVSAFESLISSSTMEEEPAEDDDDDAEAVEAGRIFRPKKQRSSGKQSA